MKRLGALLASLLLAGSLTALLASLLLAGSLTACGGTAAQEMQSIQVFAMDTVMGLRACGGETEAALAAAEDEIYRLDEALSAPGGQQCRLNSAAGGTPVDGREELRSLITRALDSSATTDRAFDIHAWRPVSSLPGALPERHLPGAETLNWHSLCLRRAEACHLEERLLSRWTRSTRIDLGAIAKGYASDWMAAIYQEHGITHGIVDLVGNTWVCGGNLEGEPWQIGIQDPARSAGALAGITGGVGRLYPSPPAAISGILRKMDSSITISLILPPAARRRADLPPSPWWRMGPRATARCATPSPRPCSSWGRTGRWSSGAAASMTLT